MNFTKIMAMVEANIWLASTLPSPRQLPEMEPGRKDELPICWEFSLKPPILERIRRKRWTGSPALNSPFQISAEIIYILHSTTLIRGQNSKAPHGIQSDLSKMQSRSRHSPILNPSVVHLILWRGSKLVSASHKLPRLELLCPPPSFIPFILTFASASHTFTTSNKWQVFKSGSSVSFAELLSLPRLYSVFPFLGKLQNAS